MARMDTVFIENEKGYKSFAQHLMSQYKVYSPEEPKEYPALLVYMVETNPDGKDFCEWTFAYKSDFEEEGE